jgi:hypothetical protein
MRCGRALRCPRGRRARDRDSVLGRYSIDHFGDTTLPLYGGYRVSK